MPPLIAKSCLQLFCYLQKAVPFSNTCTYIIVAGIAMKKQALLSKTTIIPTPSNLSIQHHYFFPVLAAICTLLP
jgi:hypothetical protein